MLSKTLLKVPFYNPKQNYYPSSGGLSRRHLSNSAEVACFESEAADFLGARHAVACSSGTIALYCIFSALGLKGKRVALPAFTWISTWKALEMAGAKPVFRDVDPYTFSLPSDVLKLKFCDAVCFVDIFGRPGEELDENSDENQNKQIIYDSAHAFGARKQGLPLGGRFPRAYSLSPTKVLTTGEGGLVTCDDSDLADEIKKIRRWAGRMTEYAAVAGRAGLRKIMANLCERSLIFKNYQEFFKDKPVRFQEIGQGITSTYKDIAIVFESEEERNELQRCLNEHGVETRIYFEPLCDGLINTDNLYKTILCLPSWLGFPQDDVLAVLSDYYQKTKECEKCHGKR